MSEEIVERDDYPLRAASYVECHAKIPGQPEDWRVICEICGNVSEKAGCPLGRSIAPR